MKRLSENSLLIACLLWLLVVVGCGTSAPPPTDAPEATDTPEAPEATPSTETPPDITVEQQELQVQPAVDPGLDVVRNYTRMFYDGEMEELRANFSEEMKTDFPPGRLQVMRERIREGLGEEIEIVGERSQTRDEYRGFVRWARFSKHDGLIEIQWVLRQDDTVAGFIIREAQAGREPSTGAGE
jgi:hypothetical protein